jgi:hypothetical protein
MFGMLKETGGTALKSMAPAVTRGSQSAGGAGGVGGPAQNELRGVGGQ